MKKLAGSICAALLMSAATLATVPVAPALAGGATGASPSSWSTAEQTALGAAAGFRGDGPLAVVGAFSSITTSVVTTASGAVTVAQRSVVATDGSGVVVVNLTVLGGRQLVVTERSPSAGYSGETLVLGPGTSTVTGRYPLQGTTATALTSDGQRGRGLHGGIVATDAVAHPSDRRPVARLVTIGGCGPRPQIPGVIGSTFGPLIDGEGIVTCSTGESLAEIVSDYEGSTHVGNTATGTGGGTHLGINAYAACTIVTATHSFHTAELYSVNGIVQGGATSSSANLHCA